MDRRYSWFADVPGLHERIRSALDEHRPVYVLVVEKWRTEIPDSLLDYLVANYHPMDEVTIPGQNLGRVTLYRLTE